MKYMILIGGNHAGWAALGEAGMKRIMDAHNALFDELTASGELVETNELGVTAEDARVVRVTNGALTVTDGPFVESKEIVAGYYIVDVADIDRATTIASRIVEAEFAPVEVRLINEEQPDH